MVLIPVRGIRGAITVKENTREAILEATKELLLALVRENKLAVEDIAGIFFTLTPDLNAEFPALAARELGWHYVPLLCAREIDVPGSLPRVIRVLLLANTEKSQEEIKHLYLREAAVLRPDLALPQNSQQEERGDGTK
ncbi:chorismate mutase [Ammonifex degensii KC4]|uniref:chorismate mutase n=1 Tax=Ammonifex degensii (strain DSM 10501 / KC4) TaxID=429009 RepID=C9R7W9_AMMDK|nr:chorismate mutase [Ammonifex degensii]ACX52398.1 chorismate mutase [Ammonifex degensii KC4]